MPKISVLIPVYNGAKFVSETIQSILNQTFNDYEIVVVDDGSTDATKSIIDEFTKQFPNKIRYIYQDNSGVSIARNTAINNAKGEFIAFLDSDDYSAKNRLEEEIRIIESDSRIGLVHANVTKVDGNGKVIETDLRAKQYLSGNIFEHLFLRKANIACSTVLFRKSCCNRIGLFDVHLTKLGCEDRDFWLRLSKEYKIVYIDKILSFYRITPQSMSQNVDQMFKARLYIINKYCPENDKNKLYIRNKALSKIFRDSGDELLLQKKYSSARREYKKAILHNPFSFWPWVNLIKTIIREKYE
jgi:glycosyltransferase involved in cell wall biosynthesis